MKVMYLFLVFLFLNACSHAQIPDAAMSDTINIPPNTIRIYAQVISTDKNTAVVKVIEVIAHGAGIVNILSAGQEVTIRVSKNLKITARETIEADLREKMGIDASGSTYSLLSAKKVER